MATKTDDDTGAMIDYLEERIDGLYRLLGAVGSLLTTYVNGRTVDEAEGTSAP